MGKANYKHRKSMNKFFEYIYTLIISWLYGGLN